MMIACRRKARERRLIEERVLREQIQMVELEDQFDARLVPEGFERGNSREDCQFPPPPFFYFWCKSKTTKPTHPSIDFGLETLAVKFHRDRLRQISQSFALERSRERVSVAVIDGSVSFLCLSL